MADPTLLVRLELKPGARLTVGNATFDIRAALANEPDKLAGGIGFGPRLLVSEQALRATGLIQPGSLVRWHYRLRLPASETERRGFGGGRRRRRARNFRKPAGTSARRVKASPRLERNIDRFTQFLTMVGLTALLVGGVGVGNAVKSHLDRRREVIATLKALGASGSRVFAVYLTQVLLLALLGGADRPGAGRGFALRRRLDSGRRSFRCRSCRRCIPAIWRWRSSTVCSPRSPSRCGRSAARMTCRSAPCSATWWRRSRAWPRKAYMALAALAALALTALAVLLAYDRRVAIIYVDDRCRGVRAAAAGRRAADVLPPARRAPARPACAWRSPISTGRAR